MLNGIFYNSNKADCSIHESGRMCYEALKLSDKYNLLYSENQFPEKEEVDFIVFNHHPWVNNWMHDYAKGLDKLTFTIVTEVGPYENIMPYTPLVFNNYIILDPTIADANNIYGFPRPLEIYLAKEKNDDELIIGSFGFPTTGKNWEEIVARTQLEFDKALIRFHIPHATYVHNNEGEIRRIKNICNGLIHNPNINIEYTHHYMSKQELIDWCSQNTINVFLYNRNQTGLAATTDQAILSGRPLLVSQNPTFRHILQYLDPYPLTIKEAIETTLPAVRQMQIDWSPKQFAEKFENILEEKINGLR